MSKFPFLKTENGAVSISIHLCPRARRNSIIGLHAERLKVAVTAAPIEGKANCYLLEFLADVFELPKKHVHLEKGFNSRLKIVRLDGISEAKVETILDGLLSYKP